jgi:uncharacterized membrane protein
MRRTMGDYNLERETSTSWGKKKTRGKIYKVTHKLSSNFVGKLIFMLFYLVFLVLWIRGWKSLICMSWVHLKILEELFFMHFFSLFALQWLG